jgi:hypothetical protein
VWQIPQYKSSNLTYPEVTFGLAIHNGLKSDVGVYTPQATSLYSLSKGDNFSSFVASNAYD